MKIDVVFVSARHTAARAVLHEHTKISLVHFYEGMQIPLDV